MKSDLSFQQLVRNYSHFMHRYHVVIFTIFVLGGLSVATYLLYQATTSAQASSDQSASTNFDKTTIDRISQLHSADDTPTPLNLPSGRTNPFQE